MLRYLLIPITICLLTSKSLSDTNYRLNTPIKPSSYSLTITPYFDTNDDSAFTFNGEVDIKFTTESNTREIKLHSEGLNFTASNITLLRGATVIPLNSSTPIEFDTRYTFVYIYLETELQVGYEYTLNILYRGPIRTDLTGFYRNYYIENGVKKWLGATQMEPTHARKVYPCFDEPDLKATFTLMIDRPSHYQPSLSNTKLRNTLQLGNGYVRELFYPTPRMSTYLLAFLVSEFEPAQNITIGTHEFGVYTRPEAKNQSLYAFDVGLKTVTALGDFFGIDYYSTDSNLKLDHIALPDFRAGAMENWGLIKYREAFLLYVPEESTPYYKYRVAQIVAHETTHMWFGNLVTCHWWSNTWLNEGFANYFQDYILAQVEPEVGSNDMLVTGSVYEAYTADEVPTAPAITNNDVNSPAEISGHFGTITYQKAGSVIRMMHHLIGDAAFKYGLNLYLNDNKFEAGYPDKLYAALHEGVVNYDALSTYSTFNISDIMSSWISQAGHPIVQVDIDYDTEQVTLTQKRFYINSSNRSDEVYIIPITFTTGVAPDFSDTKPVFVMDEKTHTFNISSIGQNHTWVVFNVQETGFYRVNYDNHAWQILASALKGEEREKIHYLNRAKIVNDLFAFLFADEIKFELLFDVLEFLKEETNYSVWYAAIRGFNTLRNAYFGTNVLTHIDSYALELIENVINTLTYEVKSDDDYITLRNRMQVLEFACKLGHEGCLENFVKLFEDSKGEDVAINASLQPVAYCSGLRFGNGEDYDLLWKRMATTNVANEARMIGDVLGCTTDEDKLKSYLLSPSEEDSPVRYQDLTMPLASVLSNYSHVHVVLESLRQNFTVWTSIHPSLDNILTSIAASLHTEDEIVNFDNWLSSCLQCDADAKTNARTRLAKSRSTTRWAENHRSDILNTLTDGATITAPSITLFVICLFLVFGKL